MATSPVDDKVRSYFSTFPRKTYPKGYLLVLANESPRHISYLARGRVSQYAISESGEELVVNSYKPGTFFPMSWAINQGSNDFFYKTEQETELHIVPVDEALAFLKANPDVMLDLLSRLYRGIDGVFGKLVQLMSGTARSRLIYDLLIECRRFGRQHEDGSWVVALTEVDIAAHTGLTRETVSREMQGLIKAGVVTHASKEIGITDITALEKLLDTPAS